MRLGVTLQLYLVLYFDGTGEDMHKIVRSGSIMRAGVAAGVIAGAACIVRADAQTAGTAAIVNSAISGLPAPPPSWLPPTLYQALKIPAIKGAPTAPGTLPPLLIPQYEQDPDPTGALGSYQPAGPTATAPNAFFQSLGTNGRTCFSCHQPASGMSISVNALQQIFAVSAGNDPVFAAVDGADCPNQPKNHGLLLNKGLFRIFLPVPATAQYTLTVQSDPNGCNTLPAYAQSVDPTTGKTVQMASVYRRPLVSTNLKFVTQTVANPNGAIPGNPFLCRDPIDGAAQATDPFTGLCESGNIMWDGREPTLQSQAANATLGHAQATKAPTAAQLAQIVAFETGIFSAQSYDNLAGSLYAPGAFGGPVNLSQQTAGAFPPPSPTFTIYNAWSATSGVQLAALLQMALQQESIYRGMNLFNTRKFIINNVAGLTNIAAVGNNNPGTCSTCHNQGNAGSDSFIIAQHDIGISGGSIGENGPTPSTDLPIFKLTCNNGASTVYNGTVILTNDPGKALITGQCADIGRLSVPPLRALAAHAPYFSDGSASTLSAVVAFYNKRFGIGLTSQEQADLVNFLNAL
jgi:cytochrome c peroxidase